jgi:hypothetical protein
MWRFAFLCVAGPLLAQQSGVDLVLLQENTPGTPPVRASDFHPGPGDRIAAMVFASKSQVVHRFTSDPQKVDAAIRPTRPMPFSRPFGFGSDIPHAKPLGALLDAAKLFRHQPADPSCRRVIVIVFATDDQSQSPTAADVTSALSTARIRLFAVEVRRRADDYTPPVALTTPPPLPGRYPPTTPRYAPLATYTLERLRPIAAATKGEAYSDDASIRLILSRVRSSPD